MAASKNLELACLQFEDHSTCDTQFLARCRPGLFRETTDHRLGLGQRHILLEGVLGRDVMRDDNLIAATHEWPRGRRGRIEMHVNLTGRMKVTGTNQLWVADISYVRLNREFVYLAVVLDKLSRRVVGWALDRNLTSRLSLTALNSALESRKPGQGLVHHSDRGTQYLHTSYVGTLRKYSIVASVNRPGNPGGKDYASHCTSWVRCDTTSLARRRRDSFMPWAFRGGLSPGCSYRQWFLSLQVWPRISPWRFHILTHCGVMPSKTAISFPVSRPALRNRS